MDQPPSLKLDASATGQRMRYDATLGVHMQVQLHSASATVECQMPGGAGEVPVQACLGRFGSYGPVGTRFRQFEPVHAKSRKGCTVDLAHGGIRPLQLPGAAWQKSSYSNPSGNCVEMARLSAGRVAVRDSKRPGDPVLVFTRTEWSAFLSALRTVAVC